MIDLFTRATPNGHKISIELEELGLPYRAIPVNISTGEQFDPTFLAISPNNKIPAIVDHDGPDGAPFALFESGAILLYLAEKAGSLLPRDTAGRFLVIHARDRRPPCGATRPGCARPLPGRPHPHQGGPGDPFRRHAVPAPVTRGA